MTPLSSPGRTAKPGVEGSPAVFDLSRVQVLVLVGLVAALPQLLLVSGVRIPIFTPALGLVGLLGPMIFFVYLGVGRWWAWREPGERLIISVLLSLLALMLVGLLADAMLPLLGVAHPLSSGPVFAFTDLLDAALAWSGVRAMPSRLSGPRGLGWGWRERSCVSLAAVSVAIAALGATRLNNGAGGGLTTFDIGMVLVILVALFGWRERLDQVAMPVAIYGLALALLFMTSLRGWYTTGHDIQHEMQVFLNTAGRGRWSPDSKDGYNSCLSITILPTILLRWTRAFPPYLYKVAFQCFFAQAAVLVYYLGRRFSSQTYALLSVTFFLGFVAYIEDMPMLNRQELGMLFFGAMVLILLSTEYPLRRRYRLFVVLATGMVVSHYSTSYFTLAAFFLALVARPVVKRLPLFFDRAGGPETDPAVTRSPERVLRWRLVLVLTLLVAVWNLAVNQAFSPLQTEIVNGLKGYGQTGASAVAQTGIISLHPKTHQQALDDLLASLAALRARRPAAFIASPPPSAQISPTVPSDMLPVTALGRALGGSEHGANLINRLWRLVAAFGLQVLLGVGMLRLLFSRRLRSAWNIDGLLLAIGVAVVLVVQTAVPAATSDYGVGRSLQQALFLLGPVAGLGAVTILGGLRNRRAPDAAAALSIGLFASTSGCVPQLLGAYGPQLQLNNAGDYYDQLYLHAQDVAGLTWMEGVVNRSARYPNIQMDNALFGVARSLGGLNAFTVDYPADVSRGSYVILGYTNTTNDKSAFTSDGYEIWLRYPTSILNSAKNLIYTNGAVAVYR